MKKLIILLLALAFIFSLSGCSGSEIRADDIKFIEIREGSFKSAYSVDEGIDFSNVLIVIYLRDNKGEVVEKVLPSMVEGYDATTTTAPTETRAMRVKYKGIYTSYWNYIVTNDTVINTKARLKLSEQVADNQFLVTVSIELDDLVEVKAMMMEVSFDTTRLSHKSIQALNTGWNAEKRTKTPGSFNLLYSFQPNTQTITNDGEIFVLVFDIESEGRPNVELKNIVLSYGEMDIYLPRVKLR